MILLVEVMEILIIEPPNLVLLLDPQVQPRDLIDNEQQDTRDDERPSGAGAGGSELEAQLFPVVVPPAAGVGVAADAVEGGDPLGGEEAGEQVADDAADADVPVMRDLDRPSSRLCRSCAASSALDGMMPRFRPSLRRRWLRCREVSGCLAGASSKVIFM